jgi:hypothetical protein
MINFKARTNSGPAWFKMNTFLQALYNKLRDAKFLLPKPHPGRHLTTRGLINNNYNNSSSSGRISREDY